MSRQDCPLSDTYHRECLSSPCRAQIEVNILVSFYSWMDFTAGQQTSLKAGNRGQSLPSSSLFLNARSKKHRLSCGHSIYCRKLSMTLIPKKRKKKKKKVDPGILLPVVSLIIHVCLVTRLVFFLFQPPYLISINCFPIADIVDL